MKLIRIITLFAILISLNACDEEEKIYQTIIVVTDNQLNEISEGTVTVYGGREDFFLKTNPISEHDLSISNPIIIPESKHENTNYWIDAVSGNL
ncbi:MAG: hypothetical protein RLO81_14075, partial [Fulvivirga sp.]|uniref:hypothetical protein n=1 Tax=Fulvivirga sp. TaxID=1931237 RepID=UPI0032EE4368